MMKGVVLGLAVFALAVAMVLYRCSAGDPAMPNDAVSLPQPKSLTNAELPPGAPIRPCTIAEAREAMKAPAGQGGGANQPACAITLENLDELSGASAASR